MHAFNFDLFTWVFWGAATILVLAGLGMDVVVPALLGLWGTGLRWLLWFVIIVCLVIMVVMGGIWLLVRY